MLLPDEAETPVKGHHNYKHKDSRNHAPAIMRKYGYTLLFTLGVGFLFVIIHVLLTKLTLDSEVYSLPIPAKINLTKEHLWRGQGGYGGQVLSALPMELPSDEQPYQINMAPMSKRSTTLPIKLSALPSVKCREYICNYTTINDLPTLLQQWAQPESEECRGLYTMFLKHFHVQWRTGELRLPTLFEMKMFKWLGQSLLALRQAKKQTITFIYNKLTSEGVIINPLRQKRPKSSKFPLSEYQYATQLSHNTASFCDFCRYKNFTAHDVFGRLESKYTVTAANAFKLDQWHGLVAFRDHNPLSWTLEHFMDAIQLSKRWYMAAQSSSPSYLYRYTTWDLLPASGSSQVHPHLHLFLTPIAYGHPNKWYRVAETYQQTYSGRDYFQDLILLHTQLKLDIKHGDATALVYLTPVRNNELLVIAPDASTNFFELVFFMLRAYIDKLQECSFSMVLAYPALSGPHSKMPAIAWMVSRGSNQDVRSDISSMEMFASSNIDADFFQLARTLKEFKSDYLNNASRGNEDSMFNTYLKKVFD